MKKDNNALQWSEESLEIFDILNNTETSIFLTGRAGTGKSTLLQYFLTQTKKKTVVLAPTGVAALNVGGVTIHSFFRFSTHVNLDEVRKSLKAVSNPEIYQAIEILVIDEISMVRADIFDCIDFFLRNIRESNLPFGGVQIFLIGDLYQLPPVVTSDEKDFFAERYSSPYFFAADVITSGESNLIFKELTQVYRQSDETFISILNAIRNRTCGENDLKSLNQRVTPIPPMLQNSLLTLTMTNKKAQSINALHLETLHNDPYHFQAKIIGDFDLKSAPTDAELILKLQARVMFLNNEPTGLWVNGTLGTVVDFEILEDGEVAVWVEIDDGDTVLVVPHTWEIKRYVYNPASRSLAQEMLGAFRQIPLRLSWAITIHKSQGKTFDRVVIDLERGSFAHGQTYVALSRARTLEGIWLTRPMKLSDIRLDYAVMKFLTQFQYKISEQALSFDDKILLLKHAIQTKEPLEIIYLKAQDVKSKRHILVQSIGEMTYQGKPFQGIVAYCLLRKQERVFRIDRILEMRKSE